MDRPTGLSEEMVARWADRLQAMARTGLFYASDDYDRERYQRILDVAAEMFSCLTGLPPLEIETRLARDAGYVTPKVGVGAAIFDESGRLLLLQRPDSGLWGLPVGWSEVGETAASGIVREVREETGLLVRPKRILGVYDSWRHGSRDVHHFYNVVFWCEVEGGTLTRTDEALDLGYFERDALPPLVPHHTPSIVDAFDAWAAGWTEAKFDW